MLFISSLSCRSLRGSWRRGEAFQQYDSHCPQAGYKCDCEKRLSVFQKGKLGINLFLHLKLSDTPFSEKLTNHFKRVNGKGKVSQFFVIVIHSVKQQPKGMFYRSRTPAEEQWQFWHSNFFPICWYWHNIWPKQIYWCWVLASPILM